MIKEIVSIIDLITQGSTRFQLDKAKIASLLEGMTSADIVALFQEVNISKAAFLTQDRELG